MINAHSRVRANRDGSVADALEIREWMLLEHVLQQLELDPVLDLSDVDIEVIGRRVTLIGTVPGPWTKARIEDTVARVSGVAGVRSQLVVGARGA